MKYVIFIGFFVICFGICGFAQGIDYNRLDPAQRDLAAQGIASLTSTNRDWLCGVCTQHPDGSFDPIWAKRLLLNKFSLQDIQQYGDLFTLMMAYRRNMEKEGLKKAKKEKKANDATQNEIPKVEDGEPALNTGVGGSPVLFTPDSDPANRSKTPKAKSEKKKSDTDRSTKEDRAQAVQDTTEKLLAQLEEMKKCGRF
jgi:hypothetical protein